MIGLGGQLLIIVALVVALGWALLLAMTDDSIMLIGLFAAPFIVGAMLPVAGIGIWLARLLHRLSARDSTARVDLAAAGILGGMASAFLAVTAWPAAWTGAAVALPIVAGALEPGAWRRRRALLSNGSTIRWTEDDPDAGV